MRLDILSKQAILEAVRKQDPLARVYLYGSRVHPDSRGGDIDLLVLSEKMDFSDKITVLIEIKRRIGEQKIDLLIRTKKVAEEDPFVKKILVEAIELKSEIP